MDHGASSYRRYLDGDESAFDEIVKELFDPLVFFIDQYVRDVYAAEDIAIDVFADVVAHPKRYNFKVTLKTYLFMLGKSRALNYIKHRRSLRESAIDDAYPLPDGGEHARNAVFAGRTFPLGARRVGKTERRHASGGASGVF